MARPVTAFRWATAAGANKADPPAPLRSQGWTAGSGLAARYLNQDLYDIALWLQYFDTDVFPTDNVLKIGRIVANNDPSSARGLTVTDVGGSAGGITVTATQGSLILNVTGAADGFQLSTATGAGSIAAGTAGLVVVGDAIPGIAPANSFYIVAPGGLSWMTPTAFTLSTQTEVVVGPHGADSSKTGLYVAFSGANGRPITVNCGPDLGGYQINALTVDGFLWTASGRRMGITNSTGGSSGCEARRPLDLLFGTAGDADTVRFKAAELSGDWSAGSGDATIVLKTRAIGSDTETVLLTSSPSDPVDDNGGTPLNLNPTTNVYWLEFATGTLADTATSERVGDVVLTIYQHEA